MAFALVGVMLASMFAVGVTASSGTFQTIQENESERSYTGGVIEIRTVEELQAMRDDLAGNYVLGNDIDASATIGWNGGAGFEPIGRTYATPFTGSFDGRGFKIYNLYINRPDNHIGLFGRVENGVVKNVGLEDVNVSGFYWVGGLVGANYNGTVSNCYSAGSVSGSWHVGGLIGSNSGPVDNCYSAGSVSGTNRVGGLIGLSSGAVSNCYSTGSVSSSVDGAGGLIGNNEVGTVSHSYSTCSVSGGGRYVGGLAGYNSGVVDDCYSTGSVSGAGPSVGGLVGANSGGTALNSYSTSSVSGTNYVGGLAGYNLLGGTVSNCYYSIGSVSGSERVGGIVGWNRAAVYNCYSAGSVSGFNSVGGIVGMNHYEGIVSNCYSTGFVGNTYYAGGIVGYNFGGTVSNCYSTSSVSGIERLGGLIGGIFDGTVSNCYSTGSVSGTSYVGGLVGYRTAGTISNSFWDKDTSGQATSAGGTGKATIEMKDVRTFTDTTWSAGLTAPWDFVSDYCKDVEDESVWDIHFSVNGGYPFLSALSEKMDGSGSAEDPYIIKTLEHLQSIKDDLTAHYALGNDIDASATHTWNDNGTGGYYGFAPIGAGATPFTGSFDGRGYKISNLYINRPANFSVGLFGIDGIGSVVQNVGLENENITGREDVGGLIGYNNGTVSNSYSTGSVSGVAAATGGLVGWGETGTITNCYSTATVNGGSLSSGGFIGYNKDGTLTNCYSTGSVSGGDYVGGLMGSNIGTVSNCYSTGSANGDSEVGGLIGYSNGLIDNCYSTGSVSGTSGAWDIGGLIGGNTGTVTNCYSTGSASGDTEVGGLIGYSNGTVSDSYSTGSVSGTWNVGGLVGANDDIVTNSFWDNQTSGQSTSAGGTGKTTTEMKNVRTFTDTTWSEGLTSAWDFVGNRYDDTGDEDIWDINSAINDGYPLFTWALPTPLPAPRLLSPPNGTFTNDSTPTFRWTAISDPAGVTYTLQYSRGNDFQNINGDLDHDGDVDNADYQIIRAAIGHSVGDPAYNSEADYDGDGRVTLVDYQIWIMHYRNFIETVTIIEDLTDNTYTVPLKNALLDNTYFWRVRAVDSAGNAGDWSEVWQLTVDTVPPPTPKLISPRDGAFIGDNTPTFRWTAVEDPSGVTYTFQYSPNRYIASIRNTIRNLRDSTCTIPNNEALELRVYYWRVWAVDGAGNVSRSSVVWWFKVVKLNVQLARTQGLL